MRRLGAERQSFVYYNGALDPPSSHRRLRFEDGIHLSDGQQEMRTTASSQETSLQKEGSVQELREAGKNLIEARTGDAV